MAVMVLVALTGLALVGAGLSRGHLLAVIAGAFLLADSLVLYVVFGPVVQTLRAVFP